MKCHIPETRLFHFYEQIISGARLFHFYKKVISAMLLFFFCYRYNEILLLLLSFVTRIMKYGFRIHITLTTLCGRVRNWIRTAVAWLPYVLCPALSMRHCESPDGRASSFISYFIVLIILSLILYVYFCLDLSIGYFSIMYI